jgi:hypothetical protein
VRDRLLREAGEAGDEGGWRLETAGRAWLRFGAEGEPQRLGDRNGNTLEFL